MPEELTPPTAPQPKKRRKRRSKAQIAADKAAKEAAAAEAAKMEEAGYEKVRARDDEGHFVADDPATPENEAWDWVKPSDVLDEEDVEKAVEIAFGSSYEADIDKLVEETYTEYKGDEEECVECNESANAAMAAAEAEVAEEEDQEPPAFGLAKIKNRRARYQARSYTPDK